MELVLLIGLPASGKSTFARERFAGTHEIISKDLMSRSGNKARKQTRALEEAFAAEKSVVLDNTNVGREERAAAIGIARAHGARVIAYRFDEDVPSCRERNEGREGAARVPLVAIYTAAKRYEPPKLDEGIDEIHAVKLGPDGFTIGG